MLPVLLLAALLVQPVAAAEPAQEVTLSYYYNTWGESVPAPAGYAPTDTVGRDLGDFGALNAPSDLFVRGREVFVLDNGNNRVMVFDETLAPLREIPVSHEAGLEDARGLFVDEEGRLFIALSGQKLILICMPDGQVEKAIPQPVSDLIPEDFLYTPTRVLVNAYGYLCVVAEGSYYGVVLMDMDGRFEGFYASDRVQGDALTILSNLMRRFFTQAQKDKMQRMLPTEYSSLAMDAEGFLYTTSATTKDKTASIKKLSPSGTNILLNSRKVPYGDQETAVVSGSQVETQFTDLCVDSDGFISALDTQRGKVFQYDQESNLIAVFGSLGDQNGTFSAPAAVDCLDDRVLVLDRGRGQFVGFAPTAYGDALRRATVLYNDGQFAASKAIWEDVCEKNAGLELAYDGLGKAALGEEDYASAMRYFRLSQNREDYAEAFEASRSVLLQKWFPLIFLAAAAGLVLLWWALSRRIRAGKRGEEKKIGRFVSPFYCMLHPADGFERLKLEKKGSHRYAWLVLLAVFVTKMLSLQATGFMFNTRRAVEINLPFEIAQVFVLFAAWVLCNWSVSTLMDGEGFAGEIWVMSAYSLTPYIVTGLSGILLSNVLSLNEAVFVSGLSALGTAWCAVCMICGIMKVHQYSFSKTLASMVLTAVGILFLLFIAFLMVSLVGQLTEFIGNIATEIRFRM